MMISTTACHRSWKICYFLLVLLLTSYPVAKSGPLWGSPAISSLKGLQTSSTSTSTLTPTIQKLETTKSPQGNTVISMVSEYRRGPRSRLRRRSKNNSAKRKFAHMSILQKELEVLPLPARILFRMFGEDFKQGTKSGRHLEGSGSGNNSGNIVNNGKEMDLSDSRVLHPDFVYSGYLSSLFNVTSIFPHVMVWIDKLITSVSTNKYLKLGRKICEKFKGWCEDHVGIGQLVMKGVGFACFGLLLFQKLSNWYHQIGETEIILDRTDNNYKSYGCNMNGIGVSYLAALNYTAIDHMGYSDLFRKLEAVIQVPRFPQTLKEYSSLIGREVADLISNVEKQLRLRLHSDFLIHQRLVMTPTEIEVLNSFQRGIVLLQTRQADATVRQLRSQILDAANQCEDLIAELNRKAIERSQNMRFASNLPLPRFIYTHIPFVPVSRGIRASTLDRLRKTIGKGMQQGASSRSERKKDRRKGSSELAIGSSMYIDTEDVSNKATTSSIVETNTGEINFDQRSTNIMSDVRRLHMNTREKVMLLEGLLHTLYTTAGHLQLHLDRYHNIRENLIKSTDLIDKKDPMHGLGKSIPYFLLPTNATSDNIWDELEKWNAESSSICSEAVLLLSLDTRQFNLDGFETMDGTTLSTTMTPTAAVDVSSKKNFSREDVRRKSATNIRGGIMTTEHKIEFKNHCRKDKRHKKKQRWRTSDTLNNINVNYFSSMPKNDVAARAMVAETHKEDSKHKSERDYDHLSRKQEDKDDGLDPLSVCAPTSVIRNDAIAKTIKRVRGGSSRGSMSYAFDHIVGDRVKEVPQELQNEMRGWKIREVTEQGARNKRNLTNPLAGNMIVTLGNVYDDANIIDIHESITMDAANGRKIRNPLLCCVELPLDCQTVLNSLVLNEALTHETINDEGHILCSCTPWIQENMNSLNVDEPPVWKQNMTITLNSRHWMAYTTSDQLEVYQSLLPATSVPPALLDHTNGVKPWVFVQFLNFSDQLDGGHKLIWFFEAIEGGNKTRVTCTISPAPQSACPFVNPFDLTYHLFSDRKRQTRKVSDFGSSLINHWINSCHLLIGEDDITATFDNINEDGRDNDQSVGNSGSYPPSPGRSYLSQRKRMSSNIKSKETPEKVLFESMSKLRDQWRANAEALKKVIISEHTFNSRLEMLTLRKKSRFNFFSLLKPKTIVKLGVWSSLSFTSYRVCQNPTETRRVLNVGKDAVKKFLQLRIKEPLISIYNDVFLNKKEHLADYEALLDAKRSMGVMLDDFIQQYKPGTSSAERERIVENMDMTPISQEYEKELKKPIQNLVSGRLARLLLIQLQFLKKELLTAMQGMDEIFTAQQVNMQLLAITPAILSFFTIKTGLKGFLGILSYSSRGKLIESAATAHRQLRSDVRSLEKTLLFTEAARHERKQKEVEHGKDKRGNKNKKSNDGLTIERMEEGMSKEDVGKMMSIIYRLQNTLIVHHSHFDSATIAQFQEDLRDVTAPNLSARQRLNIVESIKKTYPFVTHSGSRW